MNKQLAIPENLYKRLEKHAIPFVDTTPVSVIERLADFFEARQDVSAAAKSNFVNTLDLDSLSAVATTGSTSKKYNPLSPPDLLHTRCRGSFGTVTFTKWNDLLRIAHVHSFKKAKTFEALLAVTHAQIRNGNHEGDSGYHYISEIGISVQGVDARHAWMYALRLAQYVEVPVRASFEWRHNVKAAHPGELGLLEWIP